tara:strand:+ start:3287 stop:3520 length:234 start_codon:yes stop_codon:yes gene_type:complete
MEVSIYSLSIIAGFVLARLGVENTNIRLRVGKIRIHHWFWATVLMVCALFYRIPYWGWGLLLGIALEGLRRKEWGFR